MNSKDLKSFYQSRYEQSSRHTKQINKKIKWIGFLRLVFIILAVFLIIKGVKLDMWALNISGALLFLLFFRLVSIHKNFSELRKKLEKLTMINQQELLAMKGDFSSFDNGSSYLNPEHEFTYDLDIFGEKPLARAIVSRLARAARRRLATGRIARKIVLSRSIGHVVAVSRCPSAGFGMRKLLRILKIKN